MHKINWSKKMTHYYYYYWNRIGSLHMIFEKFKRNKNLGVEINWQMCVNVWKWVCAVEHPCSVQAVRYWYNREREDDHKWKKQNFFFLWLMTTTNNKHALESSRTFSTSHPAGLESATGCSCMVSSPSLVKAAPAAEKISPTCGCEDKHTTGWFIIVSDQDQQENISCRHVKKQRQGSV